MEFVDHRPDLPPLSCTLFYPTLPRSIRQNGHHRIGGHSCLGNDRTRQMGFRDRRFATATIGASRSNEMAALVLPIHANAYTVCVRIG